MNRRVAWLIAAVIAAVVIAGAAVWLLWPRDAADMAGSRAADGTESATGGADTTALAQQQLDEHLEECTRPAAELPPSCGIRIPWAADIASVDGIRYRIEKAPTVTLTPPTFRADDGILVATVTGIDHDGAATTQTYRTENWTLRGDAEITLTGVALSPW